jgi:hypothetical protein
MPRRILRKIVLYRPALVAGFAFADFGGDDASNSSVRFLSAFVDKSARIRPIEDETGFGLGY